MTKATNQTDQNVPGVFCISLDFEKYWGVHDVTAYQNVLENFRRIDEVVDKLLEVFEKYETHVTWAMVGLLGVDEKSFLKDRRIPYVNQDYSPYPLDSEKFRGIPPEITFAGPQIEKILRTKGQELGSHTFSHYYVLEEGQSEVHFREDLEAMGELGNKLNNAFKSIVFPRNQINYEYLGLCAEKGYLAFRGNQNNPYWSNSSYKKESFLKKFLRVVDAYFPISETRSFKLDNLPVKNGLVDIPASRFFRPISGKKILEKSKLRRIKNEMERAARAREIYHIWWHPHNFTSDIEGHLIQLTEILEYRIELNDKYGFVSMNMKEIAEYVKNKSSYNSNGRADDKSSF
jgi:hypothetical protein